MANWCYNEVVFSGEEFAVQDTIALFQEMQNRQNVENKICLPDYITEKGGYMIDISVNESTVNYRSRWSPNLNTLAEIADHFNVDFVSKFEEMGMGIFGEASYIDKKEFEIYLDLKDLQSYSYDEENGNYIFDGQSYEDDWTILTKLLELKKAEALRSRVSVDPRERGPSRPYLLFEKFCVRSRIERPFHNLLQRL